MLKINTIQIIIFLYIFFIEQYFLRQVQDYKIKIRTITNY